jgi:K+-transporting ATPase ATPase B chain
VTTLLLDKTGTITFGNASGGGVHPGARRGRAEVAEAALVSSLADETPEGRSIVDLATSRVRPRADDRSGAELVPFTAQTRMSGWTSRRPHASARAPPTRCASSCGAGRPGAAGADAHRRAGLATAPRRSSSIDRRPGGQWRVLGVIRLKDTVKPGMRERFDELRAMGIRTVMITGDNPLTAAAIAARPGSTTSWPRRRPRTRWR